MQWRVELFGELRAGCHTGDEERTLTWFRSQNTALLLAYLAYHLHQSHPREKLITLFWPEAENASGRHNLSVALSALRHQLEFPGIPAGSVLQADRYMVRLCPDRISTDVMEFETSLRLAESSDAHEAKIQLLSQAVELYSAEFLSGFCHEWLLPERESLKESYLNALERLIERLTATGGIEEALVYARRAVYADPLRESAQGDFLRLLAAAGQVEEAQRQYRRIKRLWKRELGHLPSLSLRRLGREINRLSADPSRFSLPLSVPPLRLAPEAGSPLALPAPNPTPEFALPSYINRFIGRRRELDRLTQWLTSESTRLVTLTGPGGSGKTRLAVHAARVLTASYPGGVCFVSLAEVANPEFIPKAILNTLESPEDPHREVLDQVVERLSKARSLLILDNFEQLVEGGAPLVRELLLRIPSTTCLITSRRCLGLTGEQEFPVPPLVTPLLREGRGTPSEELMGYESVQLFVDRAQMVRPGFVVTAETAGAVAELCQRLEGIPLALELAAARAQILSPSQMLMKLRSALDFLVSRNRDVPPRHRSLRAAIDWSYALLPHEIRRFFAIQSVFQGTWSLEAAEAVSQDPLTLDHLAYLQEASLMAAREEKGEIRFRMLEMLQEYAGEHLSLQDRAGAERRHAEYFLHMVEEAEVHLNGPQRLRWTERLDTEGDNLRAALSWSIRENPESGLRLAGALAQYWQSEGHLSEGQQWLEELLDLTPHGGKPSVRAKALRGAGMLALYKGEFRRAEDRIRESEGICRELGDKSGLAQALYFRGILARHQGRFGEEKAHFLESTELFKSLGDSSRIARFSGNFEHRVQYYRQIGDRSNLAKTLNNWGDKIRLQGDHGRASELYEEGLSLYREMHDPGGIAWSLMNLGEIRRAQGEMEEARALFREGLALWQEVGNRRGIADALVGMARSTIEGQPERAVRWLGAVEAALDELEVPRMDDRPGYGRDVSQLRETLGEACFEELWRQGREAGIDRIVSEAAGDL